MKQKAQARKSAAKKWQEVLPSGEQESELARQERERQMERERVARGAGREGITPQNETNNTEKAYEMALERNVAGEWALYEPKVGVRGEHEEGGRGRRDWVILWP